MKVLFSTILISFFIFSSLVAQEVNARKDVLVTFKKNPGKADKNLLTKNGGKIKKSFHLVPVIAVNLSENSIKALNKNPNVVSIEDDGVFKKNDAELDNTWGVKHINTGQVHDNGNKGDAVKIAVLDTGIDYNHTELSGAYVGGYDFVNNDNDPFDDDGHGTHCAGTIAGADDDTGVVGVAPNAKIYALKVLDDTGSGNFSDVISALQWCVDNGIQVTSNSYGSTRNPGTAVQLAFDNAAAAGVTSIAAAGNSGRSNGKGNTIEYPGKYSSVISVTAVDSNNERASFSSTGSEAEIAAPGVGVSSAQLNGGYVDGNGTSMATPHVAGVAALMIAGGIADQNGDGNINDEIRSRLQQTAVDLGNAGRDPHFGFGLVDAFEASNIGPVNQAPVVSISSPSEGATFANGETITLTGSASDVEDGDLSSSISWSSNLDGSLGTGNSFGLVLSEGNHTLTASVTDSGGKSSSDNVNITVGNPNSAPTISINSPGNESTFSSGQTISFSGSASDTEEGDLSNNITWSSNQDGNLGAGTSLNAILSDGVHQVTATITDSGGLSSSSVITVTVGALALDVSISTNKSSYSDRETASITTVVTDSSTGQPVSGASVTVRVIVPKNKTYAGSATTNASGQAVFNFKINSKKDGKGTYQLESTASNVGFEDGTTTGSFEVN